MIWKTKSKNLKSGTREEGATTAVFDWPRRKYNRKENEVQRLRASRSSFGNDPDIQKRFEDGRQEEMRLY